MNGKNTTGAVREVDKDFRFITNVDCTSKQGQGTKNNNPGVVLYDHRNFEEYRLYTLVVTYEGKSASNKGDKIAARAYIRYYDANGKLRVFYNTYKKSMYSACRPCKATALRRPPPRLAKNILANLCPLFI